MYPTSRSAPAVTPVPAARGLVLKEAADRVGKPIYLELSSINPVFMLPGVLAERGEELAGEFSASCLMGAGQFCTNPGLVVLRDGPETEDFVKSVGRKFADAAAGTLLSEGVEQNLRAGLVRLQRSGALVVTGNEPADEGRCCYANTLLTATGDAFLADPHGLQSEAFGNSSLFVIAKDNDQLQAIAEQLEGNLTGCYLHRNRRQRRRIVRSAGTQSYSNGSAACLTIRCRPGWQCQPR